MRLNPTYIESQRAYYLRKRLEKWQERCPVSEGPKPKEVEKFGRSVFKLLTKDGRMIFEMISRRYVWAEIKEYLTHHELERFIHAVYAFYNNV